MFAGSVKENSAENVVQGHLSGILAHKGRSVAILGDDGTEFKNKFLNEAYNQLVIKRLFSNTFHPQGYSRIGNGYNFLKWTLTKFLETNDLEWDDLLQFACYCYNIFSTCYNIFSSRNYTEQPFSLIFRWDPAEEWLTHLNTCSRYYGNNMGKVRWSFTVCMLLLQYIFHMLQYIFQQKWHRTPILPNI